MSVENNKRTKPSRREREQKKLNKKSKGQGTKVAKRGRVRQYDDNEEDYQYYK